MAEEGRNLDATTLEDHDDSISQPNTNTEPNETSIEDREDMLARHRREDKDLQKEIQKLKKSVTQGEKKKKKEVQTEIARLEEELKKKHELELKDLEEKLKTISVSENKNEENENENENDSQDEETQEPQKNQGQRVSKAQKKRAKKTAKQEEIRRQAELEVANMPDKKKIEDQSIQKICDEMSLKIRQIPPDGHCLYNAIADQLSLHRDQKSDCYALRTLAANYLRSHPDDFLPFLIDDDGECPDEEEYSTYCDKVEKTAEWGGQVEIQALSKTLQSQIVIIQANTPPLHIGEEFDEKFYVSYHRHAYGLGEHYNSLESA